MLPSSTELGRLIAEQELKGEDRAEYGAVIIKKLSQHLSSKFGKGFTKTNLYSFTQFYKMFPEIFHTVCGKSHMLLSWSHYRTLIQELNIDAREWYEREDIARYSVLHDNDHLFASKYMLYMPSPEQLRAEIERQKAILYLKEKEKGSDATI